MFRQVCNANGLIGSPRKHVLFNKSDQLKGARIPRSISASRGSSNGYYYPTPTTPGSPANGAPGSTVLFRRKLPPIEITLECTLEELFWGCKKEVIYTRNVIDQSSGDTFEREEIQMVRVKPGWKKGTKVTFEGKGNECPGGTASDVVFLISEKDHPNFKRARNVDDDLVLNVKVPLVDALTGWALNFRLLSGEIVSHSFADEIIVPGYQKVIEGQGMPVANSKDKRGNLIIKITMVFPKKLDEEQRMMLKGVLQRCS